MRRYSHNPKAMPAKQISIPQPKRHLPDKTADPIAKFSFKDGKTKSASDADAGKDIDANAMPADKMRIIIKTHPYYCFSTSV